MSLDVDNQLFIKTFISTWGLPASANQTISPQRASSRHCAPSCWPAKWDMEWYPRHRCPLANLMAPCWVFSVYFTEARRRKQKLSANHLSVSKQRIFGTMPSKDLRDIFKVLASWWLNQRQERATSVVNSSRLKENSGDTTTCVTLGK